MDKDDAIKLSKEYLNKVKNSKIDFLEAWLFGSFANGTQNDSSDVDIAIILNESAVSFDTEVRLMLIRKGEETIIELHAFAKDEFNNDIPIVNQIMKNGIRIDI